MSSLADDNAGELFRQVLVQPDRIRWRAQLLQSLSHGQREAATRLEREHSWLIDELQPLLALPGLWQIDLERLCVSVDRRYQEECTRYVRRMVKTWYYIMGENKDPNRLGVDVTTVVTLHGRCPSRSPKDRAIISTSMDQKALFPRAWNLKQRAAIFRRICLVDRYIPSLEHFITQCEVLQLASPIVQELLPNHQQSPYFTALSALTRDHVGASGRVEKPSKFSQWVIYCQIWLFAIRNRATESFARRRQELFSLALRLGCTEVVDQVNEEDSDDIQTIQACFRKLFPLLPYTMNAANEAHLARCIAQDMGLASRSRHAGSMLSPESSTTFKIVCPATSYDLSGAEHFYLEYVYPKREKGVPDNPLPFRLRDFFQAFFGTPEDFGVDESVKLVDRPPALRKTTRKSSRHRKRSEKGCPSTRATMSPDVSRDQAVAGRLVADPSCSTQTCAKHREDASRSAHLDRPDGGKDDEMGVIEENNVPPPSCHDARDHVSTRLAPRHVLPSITTALDSYHVRFTPQCLYEIQRKSDTVPEWEQLPSTEFMIFDGETYWEDNLVYIELEGGENTIVHLKEIRVVEDEEKVIVVSWGYLRSEIADMNCVNIESWPRGVSHMLSTHTQIIRGDAISGKVGQEGWNNLADGMMLEMSFGACRILKSENWSQVFR